MSVLTIAGLLLPNDGPQNNSRLWTLLYLGSFSMHFGAQIWMTFISGLSLYFSIPRHTFGCVQIVLFPKYFLLNAVLSFITLTVFLRTHNITVCNLETTSQVRLKNMHLGGNFEHMISMNTIFKIVCFTDKGCFEKKSNFR